MNWPRWPPTSKNPKPSCKAAAWCSASPPSPTAKANASAACGGASTNPMDASQVGPALKGLRPPPGKFLLALKLFEREVSARRGASVVSVVSGVDLSVQQPGSPAFG